MPKALGCGSPKAQVFIFDGLKNDAMKAARVN
jgi:hypothetical protein